MPTTYQKHLRLARGGDAESQNLLGYMLYFGEGVERDRDAAQAWFERAAAQGHPVAARSLARLAAPASPAAVARQAQAGEATYASFCAGCHGLNGVAALVDAPSFALGERLARPDYDLRQSIESGIGTMPGWGDLIAADELTHLLGFIRSLERDYRDGIDLSLRDAPRHYFLFNVMRNDPRAYRRPPARTQPPVVPTLPP